MTSLIKKEVIEIIMKRNDMKKELRIYPFYILGKIGEVNVRNLYVEEGKKQYKFEFRPHTDNDYLLYCKEEINTMSIIFTTYEELEEKLKNIKGVCKYHTGCRPENCSVGKVSSPEEICGICQESVELHLLEETACGHHFCLKCLNKYTKSKVKKVDDDDEWEIPCPNCRANLKWCYSCKDAKCECNCDLKKIEKNILLFRKIIKMGKNGKIMIEQGYSYTFTCFECGKVFNNKSKKHQDIVVDLHRKQAHKNSSTIVISKHMPKEVKVYDK